MKQDGTLRLDVRQAQDVVKGMLDRLPGYVPGWTPAEAGPGRALMHVFARYLEGLAERLNQAPDKNKLAFFDRLGIDLLPARAARAPLVFQMLQDARDGRAPARTRVGASVPGLDEPVLFETERPIGLAAAKLAEVVTLWPGRDAYADHSAAAAAGEPFTLFGPLKPVPHHVYLAHDTHFALAGKAQVEIELELVTPSSKKLEFAWEYWDGEVWRRFKEFEDREDYSFDGTEGLTRSGVIRLVADCAETAKTAVDGIEAYWLRGRLLKPLPPDPKLQAPVADRIRIRTVIQRPVVLQPDLAFADGLEVDLSKTIYPFGQQPQPGSTLYLASEEVFSKPGAEVTLAVNLADTPQQRDDANWFDNLAPVLAWEYWNGRGWSALDGKLSGDPSTFESPGEIALTVPDDMASGQVNDQEALWIRAHLKSGGYGGRREISYDGNNKTLKVVETVPPALSDLRLGYVYRSPWDRPRTCLTHGDFQYEDHTSDLYAAGRTFAVYRPVADTTPALYLGFDKPLPAEQISLYLDIQEEEGKIEGPALTWEYWDGRVWQALTAEDETAHLRLPGMVAFMGPADSAPLGRFGTERHWVRGRRTEDGRPVDSRLAGLHLNAVWAVQVQTVQDEVLGSSTGRPSEVFFFRRTPILEGEVIEVRELEGARAEVELPILKQDLLRQGLTAADLRPVTDPRTGRVREIWVRWESRPHLLFSGPDDRHYVVERSRGRVGFGDDVRGMIPPAGSAVLARTYRAGGGVVGNVPAGAISQLLAAVPSVEGVANPRAAEDGCDGELAPIVLRRGARTVRHGRQAISLADYEDLAREAAPSVGVARALPATHPSGRPAAGWVKVIIIPRSSDPRPQPSFELRRRVRNFLQPRVPAAIADRIIVTGPDYLAIGVEAVVAPVSPGQAGTVGDGARKALADFLHPLTGGPDGEGWPFGRDVYVSDVAAVLERVSGVDHVRELRLLLAGTPKGERVPVPEHRIVVAGPLDVRVEAAERLGAV